MEFWESELKEREHRCMNYERERKCMKGIKNVRGEGPEKLTRLRNVSGGVQLANEQQTNRDLTYSSAE